MCCVTFSRPIFYSNWESVKNVPKRNSQPANYSKYISHTYGFKWAHTKALNVHHKNGTSANEKRKRRENMKIISYVAEHTPTEQNIWCQTSHLFSLLDLRLPLSFSFFVRMNSISMRKSSWFEATTTPWHALSFLPRTSFPFFVPLIVLALLILSLLHSNYSIDFRIICSISLPSSSLSVCL